MLVLVDGSASGRPVFCVGVPALPLVDHNRCTYTGPDVLIGCSSETSALLLIFLNDTTLLSLTTPPFLLTISKIFFASCPTFNPFISLPKELLTFQSK